MQHSVLQAALELAGRTTLQELVDIGLSLDPLPDSDRMVVASCSGEINTSAPPCGDRRDYRPTDSLVEGIGRLLWVCACGESAIDMVVV